MLYNSQMHTHTPWQADKANCTITSYNRKYKLYIYCLLDCVTRARFKYLLVVFFIPILVRVGIQYTMGNVLVLGSYGLYIFKGSHLFLYG